MWSLLIKCRDPWQPKVNAGLWTWLVLSRREGGSKFFINISHSVRKLKSLVGDGKGKWVEACTQSGVNIIITSGPGKFMLTIILLIGKSKDLKIMNLKTDTSSSAFESLYLLFCNAWPEIHLSDLIEKDSEEKEKRKGLLAKPSNPALGNPVTRSWSALCVYSRQSPTLISGLNLRAAGFPGGVQKQKPTGHNLLGDNKNRENTHWCACTTSHPISPYKQLVCETGSRGK